MSTTREEAFTGLAAMVEKGLLESLEAAVTLPKTSMIDDLLADISPKPVRSQRLQIEELTAVVHDLAQAVKRLATHGLRIDAGKTIRGYPEALHIIESVLARLPSASPGIDKSVTVKAEPQAPFLAGLDAIDQSTMPQRRSLRIPRHPRRR